MIENNVGTTDMATSLSCKVLVVDDEAYLADLTQALLDLHGVASCVAYSAREALAIIDSDSGIGTVFTDIMMPGMTGLALAEIIAAKHPHIKIILTSGYTPLSLMDGQHQRHAFVTKPYRIEQVISLLHG